MIGLLWIMCKLFKFKHGPFILTYATKCSAFGLLPMGAPAIEMDDTPTWCFAKIAHLLLQLDLLLLTFQKHGEVVVSLTSSCK